MPLVVSFSLGVVINFSYVDAKVMSVILHHWCGHCKHLRNKRKFSSIDILLRCRKKSFRLVINQRKWFWMTCIWVLNFGISRSNSSAYSIFGILWFETCDELGPSVCWDPWANLVKIYTKVPIITLSGLHQNSVSPITQGTVTPSITTNVIDVYFQNDVLLPFILHLPILKGMKKTRQDIYDAG